MASTSAVGILADDIEALSRAGLGMVDFLAEATARVQRTIPLVAACVATHDPATRLMTGARKYGDLVGRNQHDALYGHIEYASDEVTTYRALMQRGVPVVGMAQLTGGDVRRSVRMRRLMVPHFGYGDEARLVFRDGGRLWGAIGLFRGPDDRPFDADDVTALARLSAPFARGVRIGLIAQTAQQARIDSPGPAIMVVDAQDIVVQISPNAEHRLARLRHDDHSASPSGVIAELVAAARRHARGLADQVPQIRIRDADGTWLIVHAVELAGSGDRVGEVVVSIEPARAPEVLGLVMDAFGLTPRERDILGLVLAGHDTARMASTLHLSRYTIQDHLKSIFEKAGVRSRRDLVARVFTDHYAPRLGEVPSPRGSLEL
jgi:DNA-binding CsgD family transcriptional regulator